MTIRARHRPAPLAVIDLGSNTCKLLITTEIAGTVETLLEVSRAVRLGEGLDRSGALSAAAANRTHGLFLEYAAELQRHQCQTVRCVATSAFRDATNGPALASRIEASTGIVIEPLSGKEEARLVSLAVARWLPEMTGALIMADVGGGSTEIISRAEGGAIEAVSLQLGTVRLTERWIQGDPPAEAELQAVQADCASILQSTGLPGSDGPFVGVGGTATTFCAMELGMRAYEPAVIHGSRVTIETIQRWVERCAAMPLAERRELAGLMPGRADIIIAGGLILMGLLERYGQSEMVVSDRGLRWGVLAEMLD